MDVALCGRRGRRAHCVVAAREGLRCVFDAFPSAAARVVLITNAHAPGDRVGANDPRTGSVCRRVGYDGDRHLGATSLDSLIAARGGNAPVFHIVGRAGLPLFDGLAAPMPPLARADYVGPAPDSTTIRRDAAGLRGPRCANARRCTLPMICAIRLVGGRARRHSIVSLRAGADPDPTSPPRAASGLRGQTLAGRCYEQGARSSEVRARQPVNQTIARPSAIRCARPPEVAAGIRRLRPVRDVRAGIHAEELGHPQSIPGRPHSRASSRRRCAESRHAPAEAGHRIAAPGTPACLNSRTALR